MSAGHINVHTHIFNLKSALSPFAVKVLKQRITDEIEQLDEVPSAARKQLAKLLGETTEDLLAGLQDFNEETLLRKFLKRVSGHDDVQKLLEDKAGGLPPEVRELLAGRIEDLLLRQMRRAVSWISGRLRKNRFADYRKGDVHDLFEALRIAGQAEIRGVADWLMRQLGPEDAAVALMMDITDGGDGDTEIFRRQLIETSDVVLAYPGRVLPFVKVNPRRTGELVLDAPGGAGKVKLEGHFQIMKHALEHLGFVGVKLYPTVGYDVRSGEMKKVYAYCQEHGVPLLTHCNRSGFVVSETSWQNADPGLWAGILEEFPQLKICFAHFGGSSGLTQPSLPPDHWGSRILELMAAHDGVYFDIAFHRTPMNSDEEAQRYQANLEQILSDPVRGERVLFGTDFWLIRSRLSEANHWKFFQELLGPERFDQIARTNARRFLGMPPGGGNDAFADYARFVASRHREIEAMPPAWLLETVEKDSGVANRERLEKRGRDFLPARSLAFPSWKQLLGIAAGKALKDGFERNATVKSSTAVFGGTQIGFEAGAGFSARTLDASSGTDEDGILLPPPNPQATDLAPVLDAEPDTSWLKYRLAAKLGVEAEARLDGIGLGIDVAAGKELVFTDYRIHDPDEDLVRALKSDLSAPRFALDRESVLKLGQNEAVSVQQRGTLRGKITLSLQDVFTGGLGALSEVLGAGQTLQVRVDVAATLTAKVEVKDDFKVVFARRGGTYRVAVRKQDTNSKTLRAELAAGVQFDDPEAVASVLQQLMAQHLAEPMKQLAALRQKSAAAALQAGEKTLLGRLETKLAAKGLAAVQEKLAALQEKLQQAIEKIATARVSVGFTYEYSRVETDTTLMEATIDELTLSELHEQLVQGDLAELLERAREQIPGVTLHRYLRFEELVRRKAWGFNLGGFGGFDVQQRRFAAQRSLDKRVKLSFQGSRGYTNQWADGRWIWKADFRADMPDLAPARQLALGSARAGASPPFEYGLAFLMEWRPDKLKLGKLRSILDMASTWGVLPEGKTSVEQQVGEIKAARLLGKAVRFRLQLSFDHGSLGSLLTPATDGDLGRWADALSVAMPYGKGKAHSSSTVRRELYRPLWRNVLEASQKPDFLLRPADEARRARERLRKQKMGVWSLREHDDNGLWRNNPWTLGGVLTLNSPIAPWQTFRLGLGSLSEALHAGKRLGESQVKDRIWTIYQSLTAFWTQPHHVRAVGAYLHACAVAAGARSGIAASLSASWEKADGTEDSWTLTRT